MVNSDNCTLLKILYKCIVSKNGLLIIGGMGYLYDDWDVNDGDVVKEVSELSYIDIQNKNYFKLKYIQL